MEGYVGSPWRQNAGWHRREKAGRKRTRRATQAEDLWPSLKPLIADSDSADATRQRRRKRW